MIVAFLVSHLFSSQYDITLISVQYTWHHDGLEAPQDFCHTQVVCSRTLNALQDYFTTPISSWTVGVCTCMYAAWLINVFLSFSLVQFIQHRRSALKNRDSVMGAHNPCRVTAVLHSLLTMTHKSLASLLPMHVHPLSLWSMFATVSV